ncbi:MAG: hypothetical protein ACREEM_31100 [Blastocatellia bacterium]
MKLNRLCASMLAFFLIGPAVAQTIVGPDSLSPPLPAEEKKELEKKALLLLDDLVRDAMGMRLPENRIQVLCFAADMLWKRDEARARGHLREAIAQFMAMEPVAAKEGPRQGQAWQSRLALRSQLVQTLAQYDARMALDFLKESRALVAAGAPASTPASVPESRDNQYDAEKQFETQLAIQIAENDPRMALQLAEEALKQEANYQIVEIWRRLQRKDPRTAARLSADIVAKFKTTNMMKNHGATNVINELLFELRERIREHKNPKKEATGSSQNAAPAVSLPELEQTFRDLLEIVVSSALKITVANLMDINEQGQARGLLTQAQSMLPDIEKYLPSRAAVLRTKLNQFDKAYYHPASPDSTVLSDEELEKKSAAELMAMADKARGETKDLLYSQALSKAMEAGDTDLAKQIASQHFKGADESMSREIERVEREKALKEGRIEEARKSLDRLPTEAERAQAIVRMAETTKDAKTQRQLLDEARSILGERMDTRAQVEAQMALAAAYLPFDADLGFNLLDASIEKLNTVMAASTMLMKFTQELQSDDEEMRLNQGGMAYWFTGGFDDKVLTFARKDFARTQSAIARWQHDQTRLMMNMALLSRILGNGNVEVRSRYIFGERPN